jgi:hypothetical protein
VRLALLSERLQRAKMKSQLSMTSTQQLQQRISMAASQLESIAITGDEGKRRSSSDSGIEAAGPAPTTSLQPARPHTAHVSLASIDGDISQVRTRHFYVCACSAVALAPLRSSCAKSRHHVVASNLTGCQGTARV